LEILAQLRNLQPETIQQIETMPITYGITAGIRYHQQGIEKGIEKGVKMKTRTMIEKVPTSQRFSLKEIAEFADVSIDDMIKIQNELTDH
jgi:hypothetical protein